VRPESAELQSAAVVSRRLPAPALVALLAELPTDPGPTAEAARPGPARSKPASRKSAAAAMPAVAEPALAPMPAAPIPQPLVKIAYAQADDGGKLPAGGLWPTAEAARPQPASPKPASEEIVAAPGPAVALPALVPMPAPPVPRPLMEIARAQPDARGKPQARGLLLIAGPNQTLEALYRQVYRGVAPPPFAEVAAANPLRVEAGDALFFPEPPAGWTDRRRSLQAAR
jgi:hypothetical protein